ncbi:MAG: histidine phosphatase family protein [Pseudomonadota bacterium]
MGQITLVRHGQASFGTDDYDRLSPLGHDQSAWLGGYFTQTETRFDLAVHGTLRRHRETLAGMMHCLDGVDVSEDARLNEMDYDGLLHAMLAKTGEAVPHSRAGFVDLMPRLMVAWSKGELSNQTESYAHFEQRVWEVIQEVVRADRNVLLVTSGGVIGTVLRRVLGLSPEGGTELMLNIYNASFHHFTYEFGGLRLAQFNGQPHLTGPDKEHARTYV